MMTRCLLLLLLLLPTAARAAGPLRLRTLVRDAKTSLKNTSGQADAEKALLEVADTSLVTDGQRMEIYHLCARLELSQNDAENLKLYLRQEYDTLAFFRTILKMHQYLLLSDSVSRACGLKNPHAAKARSLLLRHRMNLLGGGKYLLSREEYGEAFPFLDMYLRVPEERLMARDTYLQEDTLLRKVSFWAAMAAYNSDNPRGVLRHIDRAIDGGTEAQRASLVECKTNCYLALRDSTAWLATLLYGVKTYPRHDYFYLHLMDYYNANGYYERGLLMSDSLLHIVGGRSIYWFGKCQMYLGLRDYDRCIDAADNVIALDTTFVDAYYDKGIAYLNKAVLLSRAMDTDIRSATGKQDRVRLRGLYQYAREPMERVRELAPDDKQRWARPLYTIYLNLNLGQELAEMERILGDDQ
ncbi:MAG: hypothetical protein LUC33_00805 [Prevotellaceae bacterium]|nr:hypothetical protein [Prevotellaceae bacterium]